MDWPQDIATENRQLRKDLIEFRNAVADELAAKDIEIERLRTAGDAAFYAMCAYRDSPDKEVFQDAIDALGIALNKRVGG